MATRKPLASYERLENVEGKTSFASRTVFETTVDANKSLQRTLQNELRVVTKAITRNRAQANELVHQLLLLKSASRVPTIGAGSSSNIISSNIDTLNANTATYHRRWTKRFFVDHKGSEPKPNIDTFRRRNIEQQSFFFHTQPPWLSKESDELMSIVSRYVEEHQNAHDHPPQQQPPPPLPPTVVANRIDHSSVINQCITTNDKKSSPTIDFQVIADILHGNQMGMSGRITSSLLVNHRRSATECEIQYYTENNRNTRKLLFNDARERNALEHAVASMISTDGIANMNWDKIAEAVGKASPSPYQYTALDCLFAYHTKLKTPSSHLQTTSSVWTREEDELLLKFIAAAGPQAVVDSKNTLIQNTLCTQMLPHKSKKQIFSRVNHSLLNPNMQRNDWSDYEERRLPICMKVYFTPNAQDGLQLYCASTHCYGRSTKSVVDKWNRSINPAYTTKPFTTEEDEALLKVMRSILGNDNNEIGGAQSQVQHHIGWVELSQTYFPHRHPQRLQSRWSELATDQDIINREKVKLADTNIAKALKDKPQLRRQKRKRSVMN